ncbi:transcriptional regulator [Methanoculleus bourgensis MS2]|uniref:Transcriptional regulator n=1 Tax=Methanoculleus bourgensis (strain ATCC 43281 / DSM 3045 / OCM 15 / MS2) TaxID=1201294 RepID=I7LN82_METBM|nr:hypothetical protein [Methanoculleus bourgensis]CCJ36889.1 transcriptional regulator [Methanoculleus bourgensis MS2]
MSCRAGLVERYESRIERIITPLRSAGMPVSTFSSTPIGFTLTMRKDLLTGSVLREMGLNERQVLAVERIKNEGSGTSGDDHSLTGISATTAFRDLKALVDLGILESEGPSKKKTRYILRKGPPLGVDIFRAV